MSARSRKELLEQARARYRFRGREGRSRLLDEICALCGYERKYAIKVLGGRRPLAGESGLRRGGSAASLSTGICSPTSANGPGRCTSLAHAPIERTTTRAWNRRIGPTCGN